MGEPLENVRVGMTGRREVIVTRDLTVGAHLDGMPLPLWHEPRSITRG
jgi:hypothetical protein